MESEYLHCDLIRSEELCIPTVNILGPDLLHTIGGGIPTPVNITEPSDIVTIVF